MAAETSKDVRQLVLYEIYVRNHGPHGTFADVEADLPRIRAIGVDFIWFMPIHPIGQMHRKGRLGCPYAIADYWAVNPEYGSREDFEHLIQKAHALGLKVMIDVVYNHTAHDSLLVRQHPEWFHQDAEGQPISTVPAWSDVIDLKHPQPALTDYLVETLQMWAALGVDGFRCDVASLLPLGFWLRARQAVAEVKPGVVWLAESVHTGWVSERRQAGLPTLSDGELYRAFDILYDYDIWPIWQAAVTGEQPVVRYLEMVRFQDGIYPANYVKMRCVENHDQPRIMALAPSRAQALAWTAWQAFNKGALLFYAGQEAGATHRPSLFDVDKIDWDGYPLQPFLTRLARLKKQTALHDGTFTILSAAPAVQAVWWQPQGGLYGIFNVEANSGMTAVTLPDGVYHDLLSDEEVTVKAGQMRLPAAASILAFQEALPRPHPFFAPLLDTSLEA